MQVREGAALAHCIRRRYKQTLPGTFSRSLKHAHSQVLQYPGSQSPLMSIRLTEWQKTLSCLKLQIVLSIHSDLICILSSEWVKGQRKKSAILTITEECAKFSWMVISILLLYSALTVFSNQLLSISDSAGIDLIV